VRAKKRLIYAQGLIEEIGLEKDRLELIHLAAGTKPTIDRLARDLLAREDLLGPLPEGVRDRGDNGNSYKGVMA
jgi:coenzyme F420-reducing hydrogenase delta subunit